MMMAVETFRVPRLRSVHSRKLLGRVVYAAKLDRMAGTLEKDALDILRPRRCGHCALRNLLPCPRRITVASVAQFFFHRRQHRGLGDSMPNVTAGTPRRKDERVEMHLALGPGAFPHQKHGGKRKQYYSVGYSYAEHVSPPLARLKRP